MSHASDDQLLLLSYGELGEADASLVEAHLAACASCRARLERLERASVALMGIPRYGPGRADRWLVRAAFAAAAILAGIVLWRRGSHPPIERAWSPSTQWSVTAGYIAGGPSVVEIDAQLTRLEQERYHEMPD
jgi:anti-sigma factor RsiW